LRTMTTGADSAGTVTTATDKRVTRIGRFLRKFKFDEFPQLYNVFIGKMSFVGPRPDVPGYADRLSGDDRRLLELRPGITGPATIFFRYEEEILANAENPEAYNDTVLWPVKVRMNLRYLDTWNFMRDLGYILLTVLPFTARWITVLPPSPRTCDELESLKTAID
jgi:lipopolysaccharide/colanic/teichoic acid biosynthesis glycosyltransferase